MARPIQNGLLHPIKAGVMYRIYFLPDLKIHNLSFITHLLFSSISSPLCVIKKFTLVSSLIIPISFSFLFLVLSSSRFFSLFFLFFHETPLPLFYFPLLLASLFSMSKCSIDLHIFHIISSLFFYIQLYVPFRFYSSFSVLPSHHFSCIFVLIPDFFLLSSLFSYVNLFPRISGTVLSISFVMLLLNS